MNALAGLFFAAAVSGLLKQLLIALLVVVCIGAVLWAVDRYIWTIPSVVRGIIAIVVVLLLVIWLLQANGL